MKLFNRYEIQTWHYELAVVSAVLVITTILFSNNLVNWIVTAAVILTFQHAQIGDRLQERQKILDKPTVECYWKLKWLFGGKEVLWITAFILMGSYAAIVGSLMFAVYPIWREYYRAKIKPLDMGGSLSEFGIVPQESAPVAIEVEKKDKAVIRVCDVLHSEYAVYGVEGSTVYLEMKKALAGAKRIELDFINVKHVTYSFLFASIGKLVMDYDEIVFMCINTDGVFKFNDKVKDVMDKINKDYQS